MPGGSSTRRSVPARRARAASRWNRSTVPTDRPVRLVDRSSDRPWRSSTGRSTRRRSTARPWRSVPAMASPSSSEAGVRTTSHSSRMPRATASTGSKLRARSRYATTAPTACASAISRRAIVVFPLEWSPRRETVAVRGTPPGPRIASRAGKPVRTIKPSSRPESPSGRAFGRSGSGDPSSWGASDSGPGRSGRSIRSGAGSGAIASDPITSPAGLGAARPQRSWRDAKAAETFGERFAMRLAIIEHSF